MLTRICLKVARPERVRIYPGMLLNQSRLRRYNSTNSQRKIGTVTESINTGGSNTAPPKFKFKFKFGDNSAPKEETATAPIARWSVHTMPSKQVLKELNENEKTPGKTTERQLVSPPPLVEEVQEPQQVETSMTSTTGTPNTTPTSIHTATSDKKTKRRKRTLRPRKAIITLSPNAVLHLKQLLNQPTPQLLKVGTKNRGCSGTVYDLQYITEPGKYDEVVEQDGVKIVVDSKALFSVVGSEMDWVDDKLQSKFVFRNPNSKGTCGCGESFML